MSRCVVYATNVCLICVSRRFEEIVDEEETPAEAAKEKSNSKKRPRETDAMETDEQEGKLSKSQKKKQKKLKAANGEAAEAPSPEKSEKKGEEKKEKKEKSDKKAKAVETKTVAGGVQIDDHKVGNGPAAKRGNHVTVRYVGKLTNGKVFDKNTSGKPVSRQLELRRLAKSEGCCSSRSAWVAARLSRVC